MVSFDDGFAGVFAHALPVLRELRLPATVFVTTGVVDREVVPWRIAIRQIVAERRARMALRAKLLGSLGWRSLFGCLTSKTKKRFAPHMITAVNSVYKRFFPDRVESLFQRFMTWGRLEEMLASGGVTVGSHTRTHPILSGLSEAQQEREILGGRTRIEERLNISCKTFAYPFGHRSEYDSVSTGIIQANHLLGFSCEPGVNHRIDRAEIQRICVHNEPVSELQKLIEGHIDSSP